jgi:hypothetical protein
MKTRTITIPKKDVFFDVDAATHVFSVASGQNPQRSDALESDTLDPTNLSMITRYADRAVAKLREAISRFLTSETATAAEVALSSATDYEFSLSVEDAFQDELLAPLALAMESYVAHCAIADWYRAAGDAQAAAYVQATDGDVIRIKNYLVNRKFPARS